MSVFVQYHREEERERHVGNRVDDVRQGAHAVPFLIHLKESTSSNLHEEERTIQSSVRPKRRRSRERGEVRLGQKLFVNGFARRGAFVHRIDHEFRSIVALHGKECRIGLEPFFVSIDESAVRAKSGEFHPFAPRKGTFMSWKLSWAVIMPASAARPGMKIASNPGVYRIFLSSFVRFLVKL